MPQQSALRCSWQSSVRGHRLGGPGRLQLPWSPDRHCLLCLAHVTLWLLLLMLMLQLKLLLIVLNTMLVRLLRCESILR